MFRYLITQRRIILTFPDPYGSFLYPEMQSSYTIVLILRCLDGEPSEESKELYDDVITIWEHMMKKIF